MRWFLLLSCAVLLTAADHGAFRAHLVPEAGLIVSVPADWSEQPYQSGVALVLRSPALPGPAEARAAAERERSRGAVSVVTCHLEAGTTLAAFAARCRQDLERVGTNVRVEEDGLVERSDLPLHRLRYRIDLGPYTFVQVLHVLVVGDTGVCLTAGCGAEAWPRWQADCYALAAGLRRSATPPRS